MPAFRRNILSPSSALKSLRVYTAPNPEEEHYDPHCRENLKYHNMGFIMHDIEFF
jgi:hypothetical protein